MTDLPSNVSVCGVKGTFAYARLVAGDADGVMDLVPVVGLVVTLTASPTYLLNATASPKALVIVPEPLALVTDSNGDLRDVDGNSTAYVIASDDVDLNPHDWTYTVSFSGPGSDKFRAYSAAFPGGTTVDLSLITPIPSALGISVSVAQAAEAAAAAYATAAAASAVTATAATATKVDKGALVYDVTDYGALGTYNGTSGSDDTTAILAAITALQAAGVGGTIFFPPCASGLSYRCTSTLPNVSGVRLAGANRATTRVRFIGCDMFTVASGSLKELIIEGLYISVIGGHMVNLTASGSFYFNVIRDCILYAQSDDKSIVYQNGSGDFLENWWTNLDVTRAQTSTSPLFDVRNSAGGANGNVWKRIRLNSNNCTGAPAIRVDSTVTGSYAYGNTFEDIVGEQNPAGLIHLYSNNNASIRNCQDWDASTTYTDHVIKVDKSAASTTESRNINVSCSGRFGGTLGSGIKDFYAAPNSRAITLISVGNHTTTPVVTPPTRGTVVTDEVSLRLGSSDVFQTGRNTTGNRPSASGAGVGATFYDTTLSKPIWSDGTVWKDAAGTTV